MSLKRNILITSALTYANGEIHLGHLLEAIQTDIWKRFQLMRGHLTQAAYESEIGLVRTTISQYNAPHWHAFLTAWPV